MEIGELWEGVLNQPTRGKKSRHERGVDAMNPWDHGQPRKYTILILLLLYARTTSTVLRISAADKNGGKNITPEGFSCFMESELAVVRISPTPDVPVCRQVVAREECLGDHHAWEWAASFWPALVVCAIRPSCTLSICGILERS